MTAFTNTEGGARVECWEIRDFLLSSRNEERFEVPQHLIDVVVRRIVPNLFFTLNDEDARKADAPGWDDFSSGPK